MTAPGSHDAPVPTVSLVDDTRLGRDAATVTAITLVSRVTGFVRVLVVAAALGNGVLGDTYHAANTVPNLVFELVAGGALQAVLVPMFVAARRTGGDVELGRVAGVVAGAITTVFVGVAVMGIVVSPLLARVLVGGGSSGDGDRVALATAFLVVFVPQVVGYGLGMVATATLAARRRFVAAAVAPMCNNAIIIAISLWYWWRRDGRPPTLDLTVAEFLVLGVGTTVAVTAFIALPVVALARSGVGWRPRWDRRDPVVAEVRRSVGWAALSVAGTWVPIGAAIVLGGRAPGGVAVFTMTFAFFVLPHALVAIPVATTTAPRVADAAQDGRPDDVAALVRYAGRTVVPLLALAGAGLFALAWPIARVAAFGDAASQGFAPIAHALAAFGPALVPYGLAFVLTRVLISLGDVRATAVRIAVAAAVGIVAMVVVAVVAPGSERAAALAAGYGVTQLLVCVALVDRARRLVVLPTIGRLAVFVARVAVATVAAGATMLAVPSMFATTRPASALALVVGGAAGAVVFVGALRAVGGPGPRTLLGTRGVAA